MLAVNPFVKLVGPDTVPPVNVLLDPVVEPLTTLPDESIPKFVMEVPLPMVLIFTVKAVTPPVFAVNPGVDTDDPLINPSALINDVVIFDELMDSNMLVTLSALPVPFLILKPPNTELIKISGFVLLSYACCRVVVDIPPVPPTDSPNLDANVIFACVISFKRVASDLIDNIAINIALSLKLEKVVNVSVVTAAIAVVKSAYFV